MAAWADTATGKKYVEQDAFFLIAEEVAFSHVRVRGLVRRDAAAAIKAPEHDRWETWIKKEQAGAPKGMETLF